MTYNRYSLIFIVNYAVYAVILGLIHWEYPIGQYC